MKENKRNIIKLVVVLLFMIIAITIVLKVGLGGCTKNPKKPVTSEYDYVATTTEDNSYDKDAISEHLIVPKTIDGDWLEGEIKIPRTLKAEEDGTITITEPIATWYNEKLTVDENIDMMEELLSSEGIEVLEMYVDEENNITFKFDEENLEKYVKCLEKRFNDTLDELHCKVSINKEFEHLIVYISEATEPIAYGMDIVKMVTWMIWAQIYTGTPYDEWSIQMTTVYEDTEEVMLEDVFGNGKEGSLHITDEIWLEMFQNLDKYSTESETQQGEMER